MSRPTETGSTLSLHHVDAIVSLQNREQRAEMMTLARAFTTLPAPISAEWIRRLFQLENKLHRIIQNDKKWFFNHHGDPDAEMFARDMHLMHSIAANSLAALIERRGEWSPIDNTESLRNAIAFQMYHHGAAIKWSFFRREPISPTVWPQLHQLYTFAVENKLHLETAVLFHDEAEFSTSIASLYIRALLLDVLNTGNLNMPQIEIADGWLAAWTSQYQLVNHADIANGRLYVDFKSSKGLQRVIRDINPAPCCYLSLAPLAAQIDMVRERLRLGLPYQGRGIPNLFAMDEHVALLEVIERLNASIESEAGRVIEPRSIVHQQQVRVVFGLNAIYETLSGTKSASSDASTFAGFTLSLEPLLTDKPLADDATATDKLLAATSGWALLDKSATGMGFMVKSGAASRVETGHLLAVQIIDATHQQSWQLISVARKIEERSDEAHQTQTRLGTEIISTTPIAVTLTHKASADDATIGESKIQALFLPGADARGRDDTLLLAISDTNLTNPNSSFTIETATTKFVLKLNRAQRKGSDWISFRFEVIA
jgi:hypothetical protein